MDTFNVGAARVSAALAAQESIVDARARSFTRWIAEGALQDGHVSKVAVAAREEHIDFCARYGQPPHGGIWMPFAPSWRELDTQNSGGLIGTELLAQLIPSLTPLSAVISAGARVVPGLTSNGAVAFPRMETGSTVGIVSETTQTGTDPGTGDPIYSPTTVPSSDPSTDQCKVAPFTLAVNTNISRRLILQNTFQNQLENVLAGDIQRRAFAELDRLILSGSGTNGEPTGILSNSDVGTYDAGANGAAPSLANLSEIEFQLGLVYAGLNPLTWFANSAIRKTVRNTATGAGLAPLWSQDNKLLGYDTAITEHVPSDFTKGSGSNLSAAVLGDFAQVVIGIWAPGLEIVFNPLSASRKANLTAFLQVGFGLMRNEAFMVCKDFATT